MGKDRYGIYSAEKFGYALGRIAPQSVGTDETMVEEFDFLVDTLEARREWRVAYAEFLLDASMSFAEKADKYLDYPMADDEALAYFKHCWELLFPDHPWPLDEAAAKKENKD